MAFTYDSRISSDRDRVRLYIRDTVSGSGPLPNDANFEDAEIDGLIAAEGTWQTAVAAAFETLAGAWARFPSFSESGGLSVNRSDIAKSYQQQAQDWRKKYGVAGTLAGSRNTHRLDAYSHDLDNVSR